MAQPGNDPQKATFTASWRPDQTYKFGIIDPEIDILQGDRAIVKGFMAARQGNNRLLIHKLL